MKVRVPKNASFSVVVTRADGTVDDYGTVASSKWGPLRKWLAKRRIERINRRRGV